MNSQPDSNLVSELLKLVQDPKYDQLKAELGAFHPFDVLGVADYEIRHTRTLAWLLDPSGSHGLGELFLRAFVRSVKPPEDFQLAFELDNVTAARTEAEFILDGKDKRLDTLVYGSNWMIAIEGKIKSGQGETQLRDYRNALHGLTRLDKPREHLLLLYLTLDGEEPLESSEESSSNEKMSSTPPWKPITWLDDVAQPLNDLLSWRQNGIDEHALFFMKSYVDLIHRLSEKGVARADELMEELVRGHDKFFNLFGNPKTNKEDQRYRDLYDIHRTQIDRLSERSVSPPAIRANEIREWFKREGWPYEEVGRSKGYTYIGFLPKDLVKSDRLRDERGERNTVVFDIVNRADEPLHAILTICDLGETFRNAANWEFRHWLWTELSKDGKPRDGPADKFARVWRWPFKSDKTAPVWSSERGSEEYTREWMGCLFGPFGMDGRISGIVDKLRSAVGRHATPSSGRSDNASS